jgi:hypothetical protein
MMFCRDREEKGWFWVQREDDQDKVDHFKPCDDYCAQLIEMRAEENKWGESDICDPCKTKLEITRAINDVLTANSFHGDDPLVHIIREHFNEEC